MESKETISQTKLKSDSLRNKDFTAYQIDSNLNTTKAYSRKDFYKISLITGEIALDFADRGIKTGTTGSTLFFATSHIPYSCNIVSEEYSGYACLFTEEFLKTNNNSESLQHSPLFKFGGTPLFHLSDNQVSFAANVFKKMIDEYNTDYVFKNDLIRTYINLLIHEALKLQPSDNFVKHKNASARVTSLFLDLLEKQFPIDDLVMSLKLKTATDYASTIGVHVNHLNHAVKAVTGKTTTAHISERIITEAKALLKHSNWSITEIAYALGFEYITYFNNFFKRFTGLTPSSYRA
ncbi:helix-turn-helix domain-containing protein [Chryseobacterium sp. MYb264]|uniref:helix-turn-helix domain-containing protein n=1 Tax=Chryseobacterium sp. MYb264 TaxID=2745153 RepID=UPI002E0F50EF|nr:helix-turn-helix domain-containing protein [Chryseobacterium sp. MYb264]